MRERDAASTRAQTAIELAPDLTRLAIARRFVRTTLADIDPDVSADLQLATSELVTNAIEHGAGDPITITITITRGDRRATVAVRSSGRSPDVGPPSTWNVAPPDAITGRGLGIVRALADHVAVRRSADDLEISVTREWSSTTAPPRSAGRS
jgi:serine/threonine-protein kinase RsbW